MERTKEFRDPVHGYISVPRIFCDHLIDTPIFQRLREIEQTGMRVLFPGARHCRFAHSLGTYHLGTHAFRQFRKNAATHFGGVNQEEWQHYQRTFSMACLLHDCAHAPFSHTFEMYYDYVNSPEPGRLQGPLLDEADDPDFRADFTNEAAGQPSPHEKASAIVLLRHFGGKIRELEGDPLLAARMILGCSHLPPADDKERLENCLIALLNGTAVDVDKLDYILRDTWASGLNNVSIDVARLLSSLTCDPHSHRLAFRRSALSVLQSVVDGRNVLYRWVFGHHKVVYNQYLLRQAVYELARRVPPGNTDRFLAQVFSLDAFEHPVDVGDGESIYLPTDHDLTVLLKKHCEQIPEAREYLFRSHRRKALWKTAAECARIFRQKSARELLLIETTAKDTLNERIAGRDAEIGFVVEKIPQSFVTIQTGDILVCLDSETCSYDELLSKEAVGELRGVFYVFAPQAVVNRRDEFVEALRAVTV